MSTQSYCTIFDTFTAKSYLYEFNQNVDKAEVHQSFDTFTTISAILEWDLDYTIDTVTFIKM